ncbi:hypothetical protein [Mesorhizobium sp.]|nr:hypothetical protein [Mesorhizobium sp.]
MIRNMGDVLAICPPYVITESEIDALVDSIRSALDGAAAANSRVGRVA